MSERRLKPEITSSADYLSNIRRRPKSFSNRFKEWLELSWLNQGLVTVVILIILWLIFNLIGLYK